MIDFTSAREHTHTDKAFTSKLNKRKTNFFISCNFFIDYNAIHANNSIILLTSIDYSVHRMHYALLKK